MQRKVLWRGGADLCKSEMAVCIVENVVARAILSRQKTAWVAAKIRGSTEASELTRPLAPERPAAAALRGHVASGSEKCVFPDALASTGRALRRVAFESRFSSGSLVSCCATTACGEQREPRNSEKICMRYGNVCV